MSVTEQAKSRSSTRFSRKADWSRGGGEMVMNTALMVVLVLVGWFLVSIPAGMFFGALLKERAKDYSPANNEIDKSRE